MVEDLLRESLGPHVATQLQTTTPPDKPEGN